MQSELINTVLVVSNHIKEAKRFVGTLRDLGYGFNKWKNITNKHVSAVVKQWQSEGKAVSTIKEYLSGVRACSNYWSGVRSRISPDNSSFGIENRVYVDNR